MEKLLIRIKQAWRWFRALTRNEEFIFYYPMIALALLASIPPNGMGFLFLLIWVIVVINNSGDDKA